VDVIHHFFNHSWRFIDAYQQGLTGRMAEWAVRKQKSHWRVGPCVMMLINAMIT
jgi:hypothetical protein